MNVAILGANSQISKSLIYNFLRHDLSKMNHDFDLNYIDLYTTSSYETFSFLQELRDNYKLNTDKINVLDYYHDELLKGYNIIINCIGVGTSTQLNNDYTKYFSVLEYYDNLCIKYLQKWNDCLYINFSSGSIYGKQNEAIDENTINKIEINNIKKEDYYFITRLYSETKHRAYNNLNIVDLRIFSYFTRFCNLEDNYFIIDIIKSVLNNTEFVTTNSDMIRDYLNPYDLFISIMSCLYLKKKNKIINTSFDIHSNQPTSKYELLCYFKDKYNLKIKYDNSFKDNGATGKKNIYCSKYNYIQGLNYEPVFSSLEGIKNESHYLLNNTNNKGVLL